jgi:hypothetical protein
MSDGILDLLPIKVRKSLVPGNKAAAAFNRDTSNSPTFLASNSRKFNKMSTPQHGDDSKIWKFRSCKCQLSLTSVTICALERLFMLYQLIFSGLHNWQSVFILYYYFEILTIKLATF